MSSSGLVNFTIGDFLLSLRKLINAFVADIGFSGSAEFAKIKNRHLPSALIV